MALCMRRARADTRRHDAPGVSRVLLPTFDFDVSDLPEDEQFAAWAAHVANSRASRPVDSGPFLAKVRFWQMEPLLVSEQRMDPFSFDRDEAMIKATPADHYTLVVVIEGRVTFSREDHDLICDAGDASLTDMTRPELMHATTRQHTIMVHIARWFLDEAMSPVDIHGPLPRTPATRVLSDFLVALLPQLPAMPVTSALPMARVVRDLLANALAGLPPRPATLESGLPIRHRVRAYIEREPPGTLSLDRMCQALGVTRSSLSRAFKVDGGVLAYDRRRRLIALHARLTDPTEARSVSDLGYAYGFAEKTHLSRVFREAFGYSPTELRRNATNHAPTAAAPGSLQETYKRALRGLS